ncbi:MAG: ATP-binding protein [Opitutales bacterium]|nr:ATP-binding protein [Opitutales bacterium]
MKIEKTSPNPNPRQNAGTISFGISSYAEDFDEDKIFAHFVCNLIKNEKIESLSLLKFLCENAIKVVLGKICLDQKTFFKEWIEGEKSAEEIKAAAEEPAEPRSTIFDHYSPLFESKAQMYISFLEYARERVVPQIRAAYEIPEKYSWTTPKMRKIQKVFGLKAAEIKFFGFLMVLSDFPNFYRYWDDSSEKLKLKIIETAAGVDAETYSSILSGESALLDFGLVAEGSIGGFETNKNVELYIRGSKKSFTNFCYKKDANKTTYDFGSFDASPVEKRILLALLKSAEPCRILFCGAPGAGKTEFAKALVKEAGANLVLPVQPKIKSEKYVAQKLTNYIVCDKIAGKDPKNIALFDECDEVLSDNFVAHRINKSIINARLEKMAGKSIWICNSAKGIDESTRRRFSFSVNFSGLSAAQKQASLNAALERANLKNRVPEGKIISIVKKYNISAADIASCVKTAAIASDAETKPQEILKIIEAAAKSMALFVHGQKDQIVAKYKNDDRFDIGAINCDADCEKILETLKKYSEARGKNQADSAMNLIFSGAPGCGKTEFAKYIARELNIKPVIKRLSDVLNKYVGESEKNAAAMFAEAEREGGLLIIDEADSLFSSREDSIWQWQSNLTNEILIGMENYRGILICTTNLMKKVDKAAMRRFQKKITFGPLKPECAVELFKKYFFPDKIRLREETVKELNSLEGLTPGDFKNIAQQLMFDSDEKTEQECLEMLRKELEYKSESFANERRVGFL